MKKSGMAALALSGVLLLSACGTPKLPGSSAGSGAASTDAAASSASVPQSAPAPESGDDFGTREFLAAHPEVTALDLSDTLTGRTVQADLDGDGSEESVSVSVEEMDLSAISREERDTVNRPVTVRLQVNGVSLSWDEPWNDGVSVTLQTTDAGRQDLCVLVSGTDLSFTLRIFRWEGGSGMLWEKESLGFTCPTVYGDGAGKLYTFESAWESCDLRSSACASPTAPS